MGTVIFVALMVIGLVGVIVCQKKQKTNPNAQTLAFVFLVCILVGAGGMLWKEFGGGEMEGIIANEVAFTEARSKVLADYAGKTWNGQKAVIIANAQYDQSPISKAGVKSMEEGLKKAGIDVTAVEVLNVPQSEDPAAMENAINAKLYNGIFDKYKDATIFVMMAQLPMDDREFIKMKCWKFDGKKKRVIVGNTDIFRMKGLIKAGKVGAAVGMKTLKEADYEKSAPSDAKAAFDIRFVLVTPANLDQIVKDHKDLFAR